MVGRMNGMVSRKQTRTRRDEIRINIYAGQKVEQGRKHEILQVQFNGGARRGAGIGVGAVVSIDIDARGAAAWRAGSSVVAGDKEDVEAALLHRAQVRGVALLADVADERRAARVHHALHRVGPLRAHGEVLADVEERVRLQ